MPLLYHSAVQGMAVFPAGMRVHICEGAGGQGAVDPAHAGYVSFSISLASRMASAISFIDLRLSILRFWMRLKASASVRP